MEMSFFCYVCVCVCATVPSFHTHRAADSHIVAALPRYFSSSWHSSSIPKYIPKGTMKLSNWQWVYCGFGHSSRRGGWV